jgi:hypothetical protein
MSGGVAALLLEVPTVLPEHRGLRVGRSVEIRDHRVQGSALAARIDRRLVVAVLVRVDRHRQASGKNTVWRSRLR